jgi:cytidylate kinase
MVVAIDGPAGAGKSTVARALAARLGFTYLDTGAMYRTVALASLRRGGGQSAASASGTAAEPSGNAASLSQTAASLSQTGASLSRTAASLSQTGASLSRTAASLSRTISIELLPDGEVMLDGEEVTSLIRDADVSEAASVIAADPEVREAMVQEQRRLLGSGSGGWVAEGRDIGTVVWPQAECKVFLTASAVARAQRRADERGVAVEGVLAELAVRDERDVGRATSPLRAAEDAVTLDTTGMTLDQVVERIAGLVAAATR